MANDKLAYLEELLLNDEGLLISLRLGNGLNMEKIDLICGILKELSDEWKKDDVIPKKAANLFVDFYQAIESSCGLYNDEKQIQIMNAADKIMDLIRECVEIN